MSLSLLFKDELRGFYKSKVMIVLWIGFPALVLLLFLITTDVSSDLGPIPVSAFAALLVGSIGGSICAIMIVVSIVNERERHVYDLFVIRPIKRRDIILSKFLAVYLCVTIAGIISLTAGLAIDFIRFGSIPQAQLASVGSAMVILLSMFAVSCSAGVLIGVFSPSILVGVILVLYGGNQMSAIVLLPVLTASSEPLFPILPGGIITIVLLALAVAVFNKKQL